MAIEVIELEFHPIWQKQPGEPDGKFLLFQRYFLASPKGSLTGAYRNYLLDNGEDRKVKDANGTWKEDCDQYQWRLRHQAYWQKKTQEDLEWREGRIRQHNAQLLDTAELLRDRAMEALAQIEVEDISAKDIAALLRLSNELTETALDLSDLNKAVRQVFAAGYEVVSGDYGKENMAIV